MLNRRLFTVFLTAVFLALALALSASAMAAEPGAAAVTTQQSAGGSLALGNGQVSPLAAYVGGGIWNYGTKVEPHPFLNMKCVWSHYWHNYKYHSATAKISGEVSKVYAYAGAWAYASKWGFVHDTGYAYWNTY